MLLKIIVNTKNYVKEYNLLVTVTVELLQFPMGPSINYILVTERRGRLNICQNTKIIKFVQK